MCLRAVHHLAKCHGIKAYRCCDDKLWWFMLANNHFFFFFSSVRAEIACMFYRDSGMLHIRVYVYVCSCNIAGCESQHFICSARFFYYYLFSASFRLEQTQKKIVFDNNHHHQSNHPKMYVTFTCSLMLHRTACAECTMWHLIFVVLRSAMSLSLLYVDSISKRAQKKLYQCYFSLPLFVHLMVCLNACQMLGRLRGKMFIAIASVHRTLHGICIQNA